MAKDYIMYQVSVIKKIFNKFLLAQEIVNEYIAKNIPNYLIEA